MDFSLKLAMQLALSIVVCSIFLFNLGQLIQQVSSKELLSTTSFKKISLSNEIIDLKIKPIILKTQQDYDLYNYIEDDIDKTKITVYDMIDISLPGVYQVRYEYTSQQGNHVDRIIDAVVTL